MPIERKQFDVSQDTLTMKILEFLQENSKYAFMSKEIADRLNEDHLDIEMLVNHLSNPDEMLERKMINGEYYYAIKKAITRFLERIF